MANLFEIKMTREEIIDGLRSQYGSEFTTPEVRAWCAMNDITYQTVTKKLKEFKVTKGKWNLEVTQEVVEDIERSFAAPAAAPAVVAPVAQNLIPDVDETFVKFGPFADVKKIIQSKLFYPTFITGLSGNGKTFSVEQACAQLNRELIRVNITIETDEESLERGAVLLLDEIDLASNKILCLQSILEGKGVFLKKIGKWVKPAAGFNVIATANTKGKGSEDGRFIGTNVLNEAFLERFPVTFEQSYPHVKIEEKMLRLHSASVGVHDDEFIKKLVDWADIIRKTFYDGGIEEIISTRRLVHIIRAYSIFKNKAKAIENCVNRFDDETKQSFMELYDKVDSDVDFDKESDESVV